MGVAVRAGESEGPGKVLLNAPDCGHDENLS